MNANQIKKNMHLLVTRNKYGHEFPIGSLVKVVHIERVKKVQSINSDVLCLTCEAAFLSGLVVWSMGESELDLPVPSAPQKRTQTPTEVLHKVMDIVSDAPEINFNNYDESQVSAINTALIDVYCLLGDWIADPKLN